MSRRRPLSEDERALWSGVVHSVTPLKRLRRPAEQADATGPVDAEATRIVAAERAVPRRETTPAKEPPPLAPLGRRLKQRVARGREPIEAKLDLHSYTQAEAHTALLRFLQRAQADGVKTVLIVTGKGTMRNARDAASGRGVLKRAVPLWLGLPEFRPLVLGFDEAHIGHGGQGALYVRLRRPRQAH